ncbi:hypothetical protein [Mesorhizobium temperatum]|uniref:ATP-dependent DNA ligase n=1 Tax=Mesorhizobium temperatum TaxID=241416 RepID=UPI0026D7409D
MRKAFTRRQHDLYFVAFDLLHLNGHDLGDMALQERRDILAGIIPPDIRIQFSQALPGTGAAVFHLVDKAGLEVANSHPKNPAARHGEGLPRPGGA